MSGERLSKYFGREVIIFNVCKYDSEFWKTHIFKNKKELFSFLNEDNIEEINKRQCNDFRFYFGGSSSPFCVHEKYECYNLPKINDRYMFVCNWDEGTYFNLISSWNDVHYDGMNFEFETISGIKFIKWKDGGLNIFISEKIE